MVDNSDEEDEYHILRKFKTINIFLSAELCKETLEDYIHNRN